MKKEDVISYYKSLSIDEQSGLLIELEAINNYYQAPLKEISESGYNNRQNACPHCESIKFIKHGKYKDIQRYKCKDCQRTFSLYTGTWMSQIHHKNKIGSYLQLMQEGLSLEKIKARLHINKKTAFDWRHKIQSSLKGVDIQEFNGITEVDETFFLHSETGNGTLTRKPRKRGKSISKRGINENHIPVIVAADRNNSISMFASKPGRITKKSLNDCMRNKLNDKVIICSDGHVSIKGIASDHNLEHHVVKASLKEYVKQGIYHIQNINSIHSRLKLWINGSMRGVATKYLQNYLNLFRYKEKNKGGNFMQEIAMASVKNKNARKEYLFTVKNIY